MALDVSNPNATPRLIRTGRTDVASIKCEQWVGAAPVLYLQVFNNAAPTPGTDKPVMVLEVPAGSTDLQLTWRKHEFQSHHGGRHFATALSIACTTAPDNNVAPTSGQEPRVTIDWEPVG